MNTTSHWADTATLPHFPPAEHNIETDTIVIGGGLTGITTAYLLHRAGKSVVLIERGRCGLIDTGHTTAHLTAVPDLRLHEIVRTFGVGAAREVWDAGMTAIGRIATIVREERIDCGFRREPGYLHAPPGEDPAPHIEGLKREAEAAAQLGIDAEYLESVPFFGTPGVRFPDQACFHPLRYLAALEDRLTVAGDNCHILEETEAGEITDQPLTVKAGGRRIRGRYLVLATHNPLQGHAGTLKSLLFQTKLSLHTSYVLGGRIPRGRVPAALFWDTRTPYDYLRVETKDDHDYVIFGGEDHKTGQEPHTEGAFARLEARLRRLLPELQIDHRWSGQVIETNDGLPYIGEIAGGQFVGTGYAGNGMTFGTVAAMMATEAACGRPPPWQDLFDPHRRKWIGGTWSYLKENKDYPWHLLKDWLGKGAAEPLETLAPGSGKVLIFEGKKVAASRDAQGHITLCSAVCPHLGCIVHWNEAERTWDCPCHGSRFQPGGDVISGPAEAPLTKIAAHERASASAG